MPLMYGSFGLYIFIMVLTLAIGGAAQWYVSSQLKRNERIPSTFGITGAQMAERMGEDLNLHSVGIMRGGYNQNFYDPRTNAITLDPQVFSGGSITSIATAVHEMGHAQQRAQGYAFFKLRSAMFPLVNLCSQAWMLIFMLGLFMGSMSGAFMIKAGIVMFSVVLVFHLVTLPVEFDASRRGLAYLREIGTPSSELVQASGVLRACAFTYVAAALTAALQLFYLLLSARDR